jgi:hypothetical protein
MHSVVLAQHPTLETIYNRKEKAQNVCAFSLSTNIEIMKKIWRIETASGVGMYASGNAGFMLNRQIHMQPQNDALLWHGLSIYADSDDPGDISAELQEFSFGFTDITQLRNWVHTDSWLQQLHRSDMVLGEYTAAAYDVIEGHSQAVFKCPVSRNAHNIASFFNLPSTAQ